MPFTTESAEYNVLQASGARRRQPEDRRRLPADHRRADQAGQRDHRPNPVNGYYLAPLYSWGINYFPLNYQSTTGNGPVIKQLYFREALQYLMNQAAVIAGPLKGYGMPTVGPVGSYPVTQLPVRHGQEGRPVPVQPDQG